MIQVGYIVIGNQHDFCEVLNDFMGKELEEQVEYILEEHLNIHVLQIAVEFLRKYEVNSADIKSKVYHLGVADLGKMSVDNAIDCGLGSRSSDKDIERLTKVKECWEQGANIDVSDLSKVNTHKFHLN